MCALVDKLRFQFYEIQDTFPCCSSGTILKGIENDTQKLAARSISNNIQHVPITENTSVSSATPFSSSFSGKAAAAIAVSAATSTNNLIPNWKWHCEFLIRVPSMRRYVIINACHLSWKLCFFRQPINTTNVSKLFPFSPFTLKTVRYGWRHVQ